MYIRGQDYLLFKFVRGDLTDFEIHYCIKQFNSMIDTGAIRYVNKMRNFENLFFGNNVAKPKWISPFLTTDPDMCFKKENPVKLPDCLQTQLLVECTDFFSSTLKKFTTRLL